MINTESLKKLKDIGCRLWIDEPMKSHTTFRIGGPADVLIEPETVEQIRDIVQICREDKIPYYVLGNGSDLLVGDQGYRGVMIHLYRNWNAVRIEGCDVIAQSGALLSQAACKARDLGLTGMEYISGIPGTLGGACVMNAGAYGGELKDILKEVTVLTPEGEIRTLSLEEMELGYRTSVIPKAGYIVLEARMSLKKGDPSEIQALMDDLKERRTSKQPLELPSAGSTFKRPEGYFAGKLIMEAGLRGYRVGDAAVSEKHCGFVVNLGDATAAQVRQLIADVQARVRENAGVELEPEVKFIGEF